MNDGLTSAPERSNAGKITALWKKAHATLFSVKTFNLTVRIIALFAIFSLPYWALVASDRYVSEANVIIEKTDKVAGPGVDIYAMVSGIGGLNRSDQLLLREYLLSVDMLQKLDAAFDLRSHYSDKSRDPLSRMWFKNTPMEWFYHYWLSRVDVVYDDFSGVLHIRTQAYDSATARSIAEFMVNEGEQKMNKLGHALAQAQVSFLTKQVELAHDRLLDATSSLLNFQNRKGLVSPKATAESINVLIAALETKRAEIETQLSSMPTDLSPTNPAVVMLNKNRQALLQQIAKKRAELAAPTGTTLSATVEEFQRLQMDVEFAQDLYKTALTALERGRMDAARTLKKVSILQAPTVPAYPLEPGRLYNLAVTILIAAVLIGVLKLLKGIVLDHVD